MTDTKPKKKHRMSLEDKNGQRKYLTPAEREQFLKAAESFPREERTFCEVLAYTGCRISEALALTAERVDLAEGTIRLETLKKREKGVFRTVPLPPHVLDTLNLVHNLRQAKKRPDRGRGHLLWDWSRAKGWYVVKNVMTAAGITHGAHACPKGLRHGYGIKAVSSGVPLNTLQDVLGHAQLSTTSIYADAMGPEKRKLIERMW